MGQQKLFRQYDGSYGHRSRQRSPACLINTGNDLKALLPAFLLELIHSQKPLLFLRQPCLLTLVFLYQLPGGNTAIIAACRQQLIRYLIFLSRLKKLL